MNLRSIIDFVTGNDGLDESKLENHLLEIRLRYKEKGILLDKEELGEVYRAEDNWECLWDNISEYDRQEIYDYVKAIKNSTRIFSVRNMYFNKKTKQRKLNEYFR